MKTHFESIDVFTVKEVIDEVTVYKCDKGHTWRETIANTLTIPLPLNFPTPNGKGICPFCLDALLSTLGKVAVGTEKSKCERKQ